TQNLIDEIQRLINELQEKTLTLLKTIEEPGISDRKAMQLLIDIYMNCSKVVSVADNLALKCRKYLEKTRG
ncbi:MAG: hypothetical protein QXM00_06340, partial [Candidatus Bathyarchaeia archaeon]